MLFHTKADSITQGACACSHKISQKCTTCATVYLYINAWSPLFPQHYQSTGHWYRMSMAHCSISACPLTSVQSISKSKSLMAFQPKFGAIPNHLWLGCRSPKRTALIKLPFFPFCLPPLLSSKRPESLLPGPSYESESR